MKYLRLIIVLIGIFVIAYPAYSSYCRREIGKGPNGFDNTSKTVENGHTEILCTGAGWDQCPTSTQKPNEQGAVDHALYEIANGNLTGEWTDPYGNEVTWWSDYVHLNSEITVTDGSSFN